MKKIILLLALFTLISCGKDGETGPKGEPGPQGEKGETGKTGLPGANGSTILSGKTAPASTLGKNGDFYLDLILGNLYGPKTETGWGTPFNMKGIKGDSGIPGKDGIDGEAGTDGTSILSGNLIPTKDIGKNGDFYINLSDYTLYGPKQNNNEWGDPVSLRNNEDNGVYVYYINPIFDVKISEDEDLNFHIMTKEYVIPNIGEKYKKLSYQIVSRYDNTPKNDVSIFWRPVYQETILPSYISMNLEGGISNGILYIDDSDSGLGDEDGKSVFRFQLKGNGDLASFGWPLAFPIKIMIQAFDIKDGGVISKNKLERYLRIH